MTKEEALKATLDYVSGGFEIENLDLSEPEFREAMLKAGLIYETKDGTLKKRGSNGIFATTREGKPISGLSDYDIEEFINLGFQEEIDVEKSPIIIQKMPGDSAALVRDKETTIGFVSPTRDTRAHWLTIEGDTRPRMLSFTTQIPPNEKGETPLLEGVWEKGPSRKDSTKYDFYHNDISQKILASRCVQAVSSQLQRATKAQWMELSFDQIQKWNSASFNAEFTVGEHTFTLEKQNRDRSADLKMDGESIGKLLDKTTRMYKHFTFVEFSVENIREKLNPKELKTLLETCYEYMVDENVRGRSIRKVNKKLKATKILTSLDQLKEFSAS